MKSKSDVPMTEKEVTDDVIKTLGKTYNDLTKKYKKYPEIKYCTSAMIKYHAWFVKMLTDKIKKIAN